MGAWVRGCVGAWVRGCVGVWVGGRLVRGCVGGRWCVVGAWAALKVLALPLLLRLCTTATYAYIVALPEAS